jgi:hypothetical protein
MYPSQHIILGILFGTFLFLLWSNYFGIIGVIIVFASSVLIDVDHYIYYALKKKDWNLKHSYLWYRSLEEKTSLWSRNKLNSVHAGCFFLHGIELIFIFLVLGFFLTKLFYFIAIGLSFHLIMDRFTENIYHDRTDKISIIYDFIKFKKLRFIDD